MAAASCGCKKPRARPKSRRAAYGAGQRDPATVRPYNLLLYHTEKEARAAAEKYARELGGTFGVTWANYGIAREKKWSVVNTTSGAAGEDRRTAPDGRAYKTEAEARAAATKYGKKYGVTYTIRPSQDIHTGYRFFSLVRAKPIS